MRGEAEMTREEAIDYLEWVRPIKPYTQDKKNVQTAIDMAIEALKDRPHGEWIPCSDMLPKENICDDGYVEPSDYVLVFGDHGNYGVSRYWGNRRTKKENPCSFSDWVDLKWKVQKPIAWMPLPEPYAEKEFKIRACKFKSQINCDFCAFHSECEGHWREGEKE